MLFWGEAAREKGKEKWCLIVFILNCWIVFMPHVINWY
jgi:hypothetical protein